MLCSRFLKKPSPSARRAALRFGRGDASARFEVAAARLRPHAADRAAPPAGDDGGVRRRAGADRRSCSSSCRRASFPIRTPTRSPSSPRRRRARRSTSWSSTRTGSPTSSAAIRTSRALVSTIGGSAAATLGGPNLGQIVVHLKPRSERKELVDEIIERLRPQLAKVPGMRGLHAESADGPDRRPGEQEPVSVLDAVARHGRALRDGADSCERRSRTCPALEDLTSDLAGHQPAGRRGHRSRQGGRARRHRQPDRERVLRRVRSALGVDDLRAGQRVQGAARAGAAIPGGSRRALSLLYFKSGTGPTDRWSRSTRWRTCDADDRAADRQPLRPADRRRRSRSAWRRARRSGDV